MTNQIPEYQKWEYQEIESCFEPIYKCFIKQTPLINELIEIIIKYIGIEHNIKGSVEKYIGHLGSGRLQFNYPRDIVTDGVYLYICDYLNNRIQVIDPNGNLINQWGKIGINNGQFNGPSNAVIYKSQIYITDELNFRIQVFSVPDGHFIHKIDCQNRCYGICIYNSHIYVSLDDICCIAVYTLTGNLIKKIDCRNTLPNISKVSLSSLIIANDRIYVSSYLHHRIICLTIEGKYINHFNGKDSGGTEFYYPSCILSIDGLIYICSHFRIQEFDKNGKFIKIISNNISLNIGGMVFLHNKCYLTDQTSQCIVVLN